MQSQLVTVGPGFRPAAKEGTKIMRPIRGQNNEYYFRDGAREYARVKWFSTVYIRGAGENAPTAREVVVGVVQKITPEIRKDIAAYIVSHVALPLAQDRRYNGHRLWPVALFVPVPT